MKQYETSPLYTDAMNVLTGLCKVLDIPHDVHTHFDGYVITFGEGRDVALHFGTYGHESALWESYGFKEDRGDITGYLTPKQVISRLLKDVES